jgi:hypothetical protein
MNLFNVPPGEGTKRFGRLDIMASNFLQSTRDHRFILKEWLDLNKVLTTERYQNGYGVDDVDFILDNALKVAKEVVAPTNDDGDNLHAVFENGRVRLVFLYNFH